MKNIDETSGKKVTEKKPLKLSKKVEVDAFLPEDKKRLATEKNPTVEAIIAGLFRFETTEQALKRLNAISNNFITSSRLPKDDDKNSIKLWIRGYNLTKEEEVQGYLGNYAKIFIDEFEGKFRLLAKKQDINLKYHPQRKRPKRKNPDWGHPALRIVKKGMVFENIEDAQKILAQLHEEYPDVSIPNVNRLYIIIYGKAEGKSTPVKKHILEIKPAREGGFFIEYKVNEQAKKPIEAKKPEAKDNKAVGYYTTMAILKKSKKKKK